MSGPREVPVQIREGALKLPLAKKREVDEVKGKGKAIRVVESESEDDSTDKEEAVIHLPDSEGELSVPSALNVWETKFVSESLWNKWKNIKIKQINLILFQRPLNFKAARSTSPDILRVIKHNGRTRFSQGP